MRSKRTIEELLEIWDNNPSFTSYRSKIKSSFPELDCLFDNSPFSYSESLWLYINDMDSPPNCRCGKVLKYIDKSSGYRKYCSHKCYSSDEEIPINRQKTMLDRYGDDYSDQIYKKVKQTMLTKYGKEHALNVDEFKEKMILTSSKNDKTAIVKKAKTTMLQRYGVESIWDVDGIKEKVKNNNKQKYGVDYPIMLDNNKVVKRIKSYHRLRNKYDYELLTSFEDYSGINPSTGGGILLWKCNTCSYEFEQYVQNIQPMCKKCNPSFKSSKENEISEFLLDNNITMIVGDKNIIKPMEIDFYSNNTGIEFNGTYWHSDDKVDKDYHLNKTKECLKNNIRLIHVFEYDWDNKKEIVKSRILSIFNKNERIFARKCEIKIISASIANEFFNENHLSGNCASSLRYGLYYNDELVAAMSFVKSRYNKKYQWELARFANKLYTNVIGGASRLFKYFVKIENPSNIISYSDRCWGEGDLYLQLGFVWSHDSPPNYCYIKGNNILTRVSAQKHKLSKLLNEFDENDTEYNNMRNNGYKRIFDCGNKVFYANFT